MARLEKSINDKVVSFTSVEKPVVFVVDMINGFTKSGALADNAILQCIKPIEKILKHKPRSIFIADAHKEHAIEFNSFPEHCLIDSEESMVVDELKPYISKNSIIYKNSTNTFHVLDKEAIIDLGDSFIIVGCCTDICIMQFALSLRTYLNQHNIDKRVIVPVNCVDTYNIPDVHEALAYNYYALMMMQQSGIEVINEFTY